MKFFQFKNLQMKYLLSNVIIALLYPVFKYVSSKQTPMLDFINASAIIALCFLIFGVIYSLILHGDLDITEYVAKRTFHGSDMKPYREFKQDKREEREGRFNYPLLTGILLLAISAIATIVCY